MRFDRSNLGAPLEQDCMTTIKINVYRDGRAWFGARWIDDEYDGSDRLEIDDNASDEQAITKARQMSLSVSGTRVVHRVPDIDTVGGRSPE